MKIDLLLSKKWTITEKVVLSLILLILILLSCYILWSWRFGFDYVFTWDTITELKEKTFQLPPVYFEPYSFSATSPLWYVSESYQPSLLKINTAAYMVFLASVLSGLSLILAALSRLRGFWFLIGALVLGLVISTFRLESNFLVNGKGPFLIIFAITGLTYYLTQFFATKLTIVQTGTIWLMVWLLIVFGVYRWSVINEPLLSMAAYGLIAGILIAAVFVFLISHEILSSLYKLVSVNSQKDKSSLVPWIVVSLVVLFNAVLIYLENSRRLDFSSFVFAPVVLFIVNLVLGFWGFKNISSQRGWFTWEGVGAWLYLGMAVISGGTIALAYATANDPLIELVEDHISISFMAMSLVFAIYILANFLHPILKGLPFHKVIYKGPFFRLLLARIGAAFLILIIFSLKKKFSYFQLQSGINNAIADFYLKEGDLTTAETFYKNAANFDFYNQRSNLALASLASAAGDKINSVYFYHQAGSRSAIEQAIIGESKALEDQDMFFEAVFSLNKGLEVFPKSHHIYTNLARLQNKAGLTDSTLYNLNKALEFCKNCETENANFLAFWIENGREDKLDEMSKMTGKASGYSFKANESAINQILGETILLKDFTVKPDSSLDMGRAAYLLNAMSSPDTDNSTDIIALSLRDFQEKRTNDMLFEQLSWAFANQNYYRENKLEGIKQLAGLAKSNSPLAALYSQSLGLWYIREGLLEEAVEYLRKAGDEESAELLNNGEFVSKLRDQQMQQAKTLAADVSLGNYKDIINKAPLNPFLLIKISDFLKENSRDLEAYNVVFYGLDFVKNSPELLKTYVVRALDLSMFDYAVEGLDRLRLLISAQEVEQLSQMIDAAKRNAETGF